MSGYDEISAAFAELRRLEDHRDAFRKLAGTLSDGNTEETADEAAARHDDERSGAMDADLEGGPSDGR